jgi:hypothetical protein
VWSWFKGYLSDRWQCTSVGQCRSSFEPVLSGVPQGSSLGPILFILYINDLPMRISHSKMVSFADDTKCYKGVHDIEHATILQQDLNEVGFWSSTWKLNFNVDKFALVHFHSWDVKFDTSYSMNGIDISEVESHKDLGIILASDLSWSRHHDYILARAYGKLSQVRRTFSDYCTVGTRKKLYVSLIRSQLIYGSQIWRPMLCKDIQKLEKLQRRATKYILQDYSIDYKLRLLSLKLLPLMMVYELNDIMFFVKNHKEPSESFDISKYVSLSGSCTTVLFRWLEFDHVSAYAELASCKQPEKHGRSNSCKLTHTCQATNTRKHNRLIRLWNALPIVDLNLSSDTIKQMVRNFLWSSFISNFDASSSCTFHFLCPCQRCMSVPKPPNYSVLGWTKS